MSGTLVTFHAHPDDEALLTAGVMAKAAALGHRVVLVVATRGEVGDAAGELTADVDLGTRRQAETEASALALGVARVVFLGYPDSGSGDEPPPGSFARADVTAAAEALATILRDEAADVVTIYDPNGGYGHPDHVQVHRVGTRAAALAGTPCVLEATINRDLLRLAADLAPTLGLDLPADVVPPDLSTWYSAPDDITHTVDVSAFVEHKRASMRAHVSQTTSATSTVRTLQVFLSLPPDLFAAAFGTEWFIERAVGDWAPTPVSTLADVFGTGVATNG